MNFLFLNQTFYPDCASSAQHLSDIARALVSRGHSVTVITANHAYDNSRLRFAKNETWKDVRILRVGSTRFGKDSKWSRVIDCASFMVLCCLRCACLRGQDVVVGMTSPPLISVLGLFASTFWRCRFVYWVLDLNPDEAVLAGWLRAQSLLARALEWLSRLSLRRAHQVIVLDQFMAARIIAKGALPEKISVVAPWSHDGAVKFDSIGRKRFRETHGLQGKFVVMYSGNHSPCHPLDTALEAARVLASDSEVVFCFIGGGSEFRKIQRLANNSGLGRAGNPEMRLKFLCLPYRPLEQISASLSAADLHLVVMGDEFVGVVHPCKIYNVLRTGAPIIYIGPQPSPVTDILAQVKEQSRFASVRHGDVAGLVNQIKRLKAEYWHVAREVDAAICAGFSQHNVLPMLIRLLECTGVQGDEGRQLHHDRLPESVDVQRPCADNPMAWQPFS